MATKKAWSKKLNSKDVSAIARKRLGIRKDHTEELIEAGDFFGALLGLVATVAVSQPSPRERKQRQKTQPKAIDDGNTIDAEWEVVDE